MHEYVVLVLSDRLYAQQRLSYALGHLYINNIVHENQDPPSIYNSCVLFLLDYYQPSIVYSAVENEEYPHVLLLHLKPDAD